MQKELIDLSPEISVTINDVWRPTIYYVIQWFNIESKTEWVLKRITINDHTSIKSTANREVKL